MAMKELENKSTMEIIKIWMPKSLLHWWGFILMIVGLLSGGLIGVTIGIIFGSLIIKLSKKSESEMSKRKKYLLSITYSVITIFLIVVAMTIVSILLGNVTA
ncbi:hypothetical protein HOA92_06670 [archaeon]|nr:hypothetical protein [archaeon]MBT6762695.1 hypothetical protein [archaeon]